MSPLEITQHSFLLHSLVEWAQTEKRETWFCLIIWIIIFFNLKLEATPEKKVLKKSPCKLAGHLKEKFPLKALYLKSSSKRVKRIIFTPQKEKRSQKKKKKVGRERNRDDGEILMILRIVKLPGSNQKIRLRKVRPPIRDCISFV